MAERALPDGELRLLVAHEASWRVSRRSPLTSELKAIGAPTITSSAATKLVQRGYLTRKWTRGKPGPLKLTLTGLEALRAAGVKTVNFVTTVTAT
jgi:hypothetical protein